jgi:hypothetical protein
MKNADKPAYPSVKPDLLDKGLSGLTKREMFAMAAMQGLCSNAFFFQQLGKYEDKAGSEVVDPFIASRSIEIADELLKQLEK